MCNALPYLGKGSVQLPKGKTHGEYYLTQLSAPFARRGRTVTSDNWFSTLDGAMSLRANGLEFVGTIKPKPYLPKGVFSTKLKVGESVAVFNYDKKVTLLCHRASTSKRVQLLSTLHHNPSVIEKVKTDVQMFYNATKGGVDTFDQLCGKTSCIRMTNRWPLCFFFNIVNLAYSNSYILLQAQKKGSKIMSRREFGVQLAQQLCKPWAMKRLQSRNMPRELRCLIGSVYSVVSEYTTEEAEPAQGSESEDEDDPDPAPVQRGPKKRMRCYMCPRSTNRKSTIFCSSCRKYTCQKHYKIICHSCAQ